MSRLLQAVSWIGTIPLDAWLPQQPLLLDQSRSLPGGLVYIRGQHEVGAGGFRHCQLVVHFGSKKSLAGVRAIFGPGHFEPTRSAAADDYVWKDESRVPGSQFERGSRPHRRNSRKDWDIIWQAAVRGDFAAIPASVRVGSYRTLKAIAADHMVPLPIVRTTYVFWGATGTGKSRAAWAAGGVESYPKDPRSKFWCGYRDHQNVIIDEFRGGIDIGHLLRWLDRYPVIVEVKGGATPLCATSIWITSNLHPRDWYPDLDPSTLEALLRRLKVTEYVKLD